MNTYTVDVEGMAKASNDLRFFKVSWIAQNSELRKCLTNVQALFSDLAQQECERIRKLHDEVGMSAFREIARRQDGAMMVAFDKHNGEVAAKSLKQRDEEITKLTEKNGQPHDHISNIEARNRKQSFLMADMKRLLMSTSTFR